MYYIYRAVRPHDGDLCRGPGIVNVAAEMLAAHRYVGTTVGFADDYGNLWDCGLRVGEEQLGTMSDDSAIFLIDTGHISRDVAESDYGNVEAVKEAYKPGGLVRGIDIDTPRRNGRLLCNDANRSAPEPGKYSNDIPGEVLMNLHKFAVIDHHTDYFLHVIGFGGILGEDMEKLLILSIGLIVGFNKRGFLHIIPGKVAQQPSNLIQAIMVVFGDKMAITALAGVNHRTTELFEGYFLACHRLYDLGASDIHLPGAFNHKDEVCNRRGVYRATGTGAHDR